MTANRHQTVTKEPSFLRALVSRWLTILSGCAVKESNLQPTLFYSSPAIPDRGHSPLYANRDLVATGPEKPKSSASNRNQTVTGSWSDTVPLSRQCTADLEACSAETKSGNSHSGDSTDASPLETRARSPGATGITSGIEAGAIWSATVGSAARPLLQGRSGVDDLFQARLLRMQMRRAIAARS
jgi:hypothetical protein